MNYFDCSDTYGYIDDKEYLENRLKYLKNSLIRARILKTVGIVGIAIDTSIFVDILNDNPELGHFGGVGAILFIMAFLYYRGQKLSDESIVDYLDYLDVEDEELLRNKKRKNQ